MGEIVLNKSKSIFYENNKTQTSLDQTQKDINYDMSFDEMFKISLRKNNQQLLERNLLKN